MSRIASLLSIPIAVLCELGDGLPKRRRELKSKDVQEIIVFGFFGIGNVLMISPILPALKKAFPGARITVAGEQISINVLKNNPHCDRLLPLPKGFFARAKLFGKNKCDLVVCGYPGNCFEAALYSYLTRAKERISYCYPTAFSNSGFLFTKAAPVAKKHYVDLNCDLLGLIGIDMPKKDRAPALYMSKEDKSAGLAFFSKNQLGEKRVVGVHIGASRGQKEKRWPVKNFAEVINSIASPRVKPVVFCGPDDTEGVLELLPLLNRKPVVAKGLSLGQVGAIISKCDVILSNDSGLMHIASAAGTKSVGIFGYSDPMISGAYTLLEPVRSSEPCSPCYSLEHPVKCGKGYRCIGEIGVTPVLKAIEKQLKRGDK